MDEEILRQNVKDAVIKYYRNTYGREKKFVPGETYLNYSGRVFDERELVSLTDSALDFWLTAGRFSRLFETRFAEFLGVNHCLLTNSGSSANLLAVSALTSPKLGSRRLVPGDEVISVASAFPTTVNPIVQNNLVPVFVDVSLSSLNIVADKIEKAVSTRTKAIFIAHTLGNPFDLDTVTELAHNHGCWIIEDVCDALGSRFHGKYAGTFGDLSTFSFFPSHHLTMGEGGAVCTNNDALKQIVESFRDWGRDCKCPPGYDNTCGKRFEKQMGTLPYGYDHKYIYSHIGYNLKITDMQAAVGVAQLEKLPLFIQARKRNFHFLYEGLKKYEGFFIMPVALPDADPSWFGFPLTVKKSAPFLRSDIVQYLEQNKIATRMLFSGNIVRHPSFDGVKYRISGTLENTDYIMKNTFWIGVYPGLTDEMLAYIVSVFDRFFEELAGRWKYVPA